MALKYYQQFRTQDVTDPELLADIATAHRDSGFLSHGGGSHAEAIRLYRKSLGLWERLTREHPENDEYWYFLASVQTSLAQLYVRDGTGGT